MRSVLSSRWTTLFPKQHSPTDFCSGEAFVFPSCEVRAVFLYNILTISVKIQNHKTRQRKNLLNTVPSRDMRLFVELPKNWLANEMQVLYLESPEGTYYEPPAGEAQVIRTHLTDNFKPEHTPSAPRIHSFDIRNGHNFFIHPPRQATLHQLHWFNRNYRAP